MLEELCKRIQRCCATPRWSRNKRNVRSCWLKGLTGFKLCATTRNNMQQGVQTDATCNIQQCWELLADHVASVCTGLYVYGNLSKLPWSPFTQSSTVWHTAITFSSEGVWTKCCVVFRLLLTAIFHSVLVRNILVNPNLFLLWNCDRGVWMFWKYMA